MMVCCVGWIACDYDGYYMYKQLRTEQKNATNRREIMGTKRMKKREKLKETKKNDTRAWTGLGIVRQ